MIGAITILRLEICDIVILVNPARTVAQPPEGNAQTMEDIYLLESVDTRISDEGGVLSLIHI